MEVLRLDEKNINKFKRYLSADVAERAMRPFAHGIVVIEGDEPRASLVWEQKNIMTGLPGESHIFSITVGDDEVNDLLFSDRGGYCAFICTDACQGSCCRKRSTQKSRL